MSELLLMAVHREQAAENPPSAVLLAVARCCNVRKVRFSPRSASALHLWVFQLPAWFEVFAQAVYRQCKYAPCKIKRKPLFVSKTIAPCILLHGKGTRGNEIICASIHFDDCSRAGAILTQIRHELLLGDLANAFGLAVKYL